MTTEVNTIHSAGSMVGQRDMSAVYREGFIAGTLGAITVAVWFLIIDTLQGRPLYTPTVLGTAVFQGREALQAADSLSPSLDMVVVFTWIQARIINPIPGVSGASGIRLVEPKTEAGLYPGASWPEYQDLRRMLRSFPELFASRMVPLYVGDEGKVERVFGLLVSDNYFDALRVRPALGRFLRPEEASQPGRERLGVELLGARRAGNRGPERRDPAVDDRDIGLELLAEDPDAAQYQGGHALKASGARRPTTRRRRAGSRR